MLCFNACQIFTGWSQLRDVQRMTLSLSLLIMEMLEVKWQNTFLFVFSIKTYYYSCETAVDMDRGLRSGPRGGGTPIKK